MLSFRKNLPEVAGTSRHRRLTLLSRRISKLDDELIRTSIVKTPGLGSDKGGTNDLSDTTCFHKLGPCIKALNGWG